MEISSLVWVVPFHFFVFFLKKTNWITEKPIGHERSTEHHSVWKYVFRLEIPILYFVVTIIHSIYCHCIESESSIYWIWNREIGQFESRQTIPPAVLPIQPKKPLLFQLQVNVNSFMESNLSLSFANSNKHFPLFRSQAPHKKQI